MEQPVSSGSKLSNKTEIQTTSSRTAPALPRPQATARSRKFRRFGRTAPNTTYQQEKAQLELGPL